MNLINNNLPFFNIFMFFYLLDLHNFENLHLYRYNGTCNKDNLHLHIIYILVKNLKMDYI